MELHTRVEEAARGFDGELSLYVLDVESGVSYAYNADTPTYLSSAIKIAVMLEVLHQVDQRRLSLDEQLEFGADDIRDGMHRLGSTRPEVRLSIATLLEYTPGTSGTSRTRSGSSRVWGASSRQRSMNDDSVHARGDRRHARRACVPIPGSKKFLRSNLSISFVISKLHWVASE